MKPLALAILGFLPIFSQGQDDPFTSGKSPPSVGQENDMLKVFPDAAGQDYFPKDKASFYTRYLSAMKEPSVKAPLPEGVEWVFRFTYLRSFHDPLAVRIVNNGGKLKVRAIRLKMDREYRPGNILSDREWILDSPSSQTIHGLLTQNEFWKPLNDTELKYAWGLDGSSWIFEIHDKDGYRLFDVWTPDALVTFTAKEFHERGDDPAQFRDFSIYKETGYKILEIGHILPDPDDRY